MNSELNLQLRGQFIPIILILLIVNLTGCAPGTPGAVEAPTLVPPSPTIAIPTTTPTETPIPTPTQTPFIPKATIKIVVHVPLSGDQSTFGTDIMRASELAVQQLAGPLNDLGYKIELASYDDQANIEVGVTNAKEIVANPEILCGVGHFNSRVMIQASEIYHK